MAEYTQPVGWQLSQDDSRDPLRGSGTTNPRIPETEPRKRRVTSKVRSPVPMSSYFYTKMASLYPSVKTASAKGAAIGALLGGASVGTAAGLSARRGMNRRSAALIDDLRDIRDARPSPRMLARMALLSSREQRYAAAIGGAGGATAGALAGHLATRKKGPVAERTA